MATEPSLVAGRDERAPRKLPMGVRTALAITTSLGRGPLPKLRGALLEKKRRRYGPLLPRTPDAIASLCCGRYRLLFSVTRDPTSVRGEELPVLERDKIFPPCGNQAKKEGWISRVKIRPRIMRGEGASQLTAVQECNRERRERKTVAMESRYKSVNRAFGG